MDVGIFLEVKSWQADGCQPFISDGVTSDPQRLGGHRPGN